jgi:hypothetical protein
MRGREEWERLRPAQDSPGEQREPDRPLKEKPGNPANQQEQSRLTELVGPVTINW